MYHYEFYCYSSTQMIVYSPKNEQLEIIVANTAQQLKLAVQGFETSSSMELYLQDEQHLTSTLAGIQFPDSLSQVKKLPAKLHAVLR